ncbi:X-ray repair cross-complementing protein 5 Ku80 [Arctopsyche grandis]|uniref:X-ray repair cross-complementing protein 5 Ku80 n=1 Tax=Arctopsyche grandis TaxID=121162 RepID=UPI00406D8FC6
MAPSSVEATVLILDIGPSVARKEKNGTLSFYEKARSCIMRIIERKIFSRPCDLIGVIIMGSEDTNHYFDSNDHRYRNLSIAIKLTTPSWDLIENLAENVKTSEYNADWIGALIVAADFLESDLGNTKVAHKKIVLMTDLKTCPKVNEVDISSVVDMYQSKELELIVIGPDIWIDEDSEPAYMMDKGKQQEESEIILKKIVSDLSGITCSFEEALLQLIFHKRKATNPYPWNVDLCIGSNISIPVSGYGKIRDDKTIGQWRKRYKGPNDEQYFNPDQIINKKSYFQKEDNTTAVDELDIVSGYLYGQTAVPFTKLDKTMEYESGPKCLTVFGFTKRSNINWNNLSGDGTTYVVARKGDENATIALDALVTTLERLNLVAIVRKVYNKSTAPHMNVLFPNVDDDYKCLSMINLAYKEDYRYMAFPSLNKKKYIANDDQIKAIDDLIDSMDLSAVDEYGREFLSLENSVNPVIQHFFDTISHRARHPDEPLPPIRPEVQELLEVPIPITKIMLEPLESVKKNFELIIHEKVKTGKYWVNQNLKQEDKSSDIAEPSTSSITPKVSTVPKVSTSVASIMASQTTRVGTVNPVKDFTELLQNGEPFDSVCEQMIESIERLVLFTLSSNNTKPLSALKALRVECVLKNTLIFNNWISQFKVALLERCKEDFFDVLVAQKLGLITKTENPSSTCDEAAAVLFYNAKSNQRGNNLNEIDTSEIDNLFD